MPGLTHGVMKNGCDEAIFESNTHIALIIESPRLANDLPFKPLRSNSLSMPPVESSKRDASEDIVIEDGR